MPDRTLVAGAVRLSVAAWLAAGAAPAFSLDDSGSGLAAPLSTSRPSFSAPATTLERGHWQLEAGYQYAADDDAGLERDMHALPFLLVRAGLSDRVELNAFWSGYSAVDTDRRDADGVSDLAVGASFQLTPDASSFSASLFSVLSLPVGDDDFSSGEVDPSLGFAWAYAPAAGPGLFGTLLASSVSDDDERETVLGTAVGLAQPLSERLGSYVEYFSVHSDAADSAHSINGGFTFLLTLDVQVDVYAGGGLNDAADDFFAGGGLAWRF